MILKENVPVSLLIVEKMVFLPDVILIQPMEHIHLEH